jgi:hypothetical protein
MHGEICDNENIKEFLSDFPLNSTFTSDLTWCALVLCWMWIWMWMLRFCQMWMSGNSVQIFSIGITITALMQPLKSIMSSTQGEAFINLHVCVERLHWCYKSLTQGVRQAALVLQKCHMRVREAALVLQKCHTRGQTGCTGVTKVSHDEGSGRLH